MADLLQLPDRRYSVIYADPPWAYGQGGKGKSSHGIARQHYDTMTTAEICAMPIRSICAEDGGACFMWATFPNIAEAIKVMEAWGFTYKTAAFVWVKKNAKSSGNYMGLGAYTRANAEVCLLGVSPGFKAGERVRSHSVRQIIETPFQGHSKSRRSRESGLWNCWATCPALNYLPARGRTDGTPGATRPRRNRRRTWNRSKQGIPGGILSWHIARTLGLV